MDILKPVKAVAKLGARKASDNKYNKERRQAQQNSYDKVGQEMKAAKKQGKRIDGSSRYQQTFDNKMIKIDQKKTRRDKFIDEF